MMASGRALATTPVGWFTRNSAVGVLKKRRLGELTPLIPTPIDQIWL